MKHFVSLLVLLPLAAQYVAAATVPRAASIVRLGRDDTGRRNSRAVDPQTSLTLDSSVIAPAFANGTPGAVGEVQSLTSTNNFINFCYGKPITDGQQFQTWSCNPVPMGDLPATSNMPSAKFTSPTNFLNVPTNQTFTISLSIRGIETGLFVSASTSFLAAPQQLNSLGQVMGHSHVVIEQLDSVNQTTPTDPTKFAFFQGLNAAAANGVLTAEVTGGLPAGAYRLSSITTAANHQPVLVPVAQHGALDDTIYFTVG